ncbi:hypothetical protein [Actinophytocola sediminis]
MDRPVMVTRTHLGRPVVAIQTDGPITIILADHAAPDWMIAAATDFASSQHERYPEPDLI